MYNLNYGGKGLIEFKFLQKHSPKPKKRKLKPVTDGYTEPLGIIRENRENEKIELEKYFMDNN